MVVINSKQFSKILLIVGFIFFSLALYGINKSPATGYEVSIYSELSTLLWIFILGSIFCGICVTVYCIYLEDQKMYTYAIIGLSLVVFTNCLLLSLPLLKGYVIYGRWDVLSHVGHIVDIVKYGSITDGNVYPVTHVYLASFQYLSNISLSTILMCLPSLFLVYYVLFTYLLSKVMFFNKKDQLLSALAATILLISYSSYQVLPTVFSMYSLPLLFYLYFKKLARKRTEVSLLLILIVILYPFFHPLISLLAIMFFLIMDFCAFLYSKTMVKEINFNFTTANVNVLPCLVSFIIFVSWLSSSSNYNVWFTNIKNMYYYFRGESYVELASGSISNIFEGLNFQIADIIELYFKMYGHISIFLILTGIASIALIKKSIPPSDPALKNMLIYQSLFPFMCIVVFINLFKTIFSFGIWRLISILCIITPIFAAYTFSELFIKNKVVQTSIITRKLGALLTILILIISSVGGIFSLYPSPWVYQMNQQITHMEINGMDWYYSYKNPEILDLNLRNSFRFADYLLGVRERQSRADIRPAERLDTSPRYKLPESILPNHFNYLNYSTFGSAFSTHIYIPLHKYDEVFYTQIYPQLEIFNAGDFEQFRSDTTVEKIYNNGEFVVHFL